MKIINKLETKILLLIGSLLLLGLGTTVALMDKYSYITFSHFVETCKQLVHTSLPFIEHINGTLAVSLPILSGSLFFIFVLASYVKTEIRLKKLLNNEMKLASTKLKNLLEKHSISSNQVKIVRYEKPLAVTYGIFKQKILISDWILNNLSDKEIEAILLHEIYHIKNKHLPIYFLGQATATILFYLPVISGVVNNIKFRLEREADKYTQQKQNTAKHLKSALIKTLLGDETLSLLPNFSLKLYEDRLNHIEGQKQQKIVSKKQLVLSLFSILILMTLFMFPTTTHADAMTYGSGEMCTSNADCGMHCDNEIQQNFTKAPLQSLIQ